MVMDESVEVAVALRYVEYFRTGDEVILEEAFAPDFLDHVSGRRGVEMMRVVRGWIEGASLIPSTRCMGLRVAVGL
ncbi:hypothetical protein OG474_32410 [Kribbella sp. NBC_01505]|uniref:hypothetical protein n=1 Tax=Kribbella sp. NBC_01505 TaxID=2903580 RepID=UPI00386B048F